MPPEPNPIREGRLRWREQQIDPNNELSDEERRRRAEAADRAFYQRMGAKSGEVRRRRAERLAHLERVNAARADERVPA